MSTKRILVAGCGDLGSSVAKYFLAKGAEVTAIRRSGTVFPQGVMGITGDISALEDSVLPDVDLIFLIMTPSSRTEEAYRAAYWNTAQRLVKRYQASKTPLFFVSSTSVYGQNSGEWIDELSVPEWSSATAQVLLETEALLAGSLSSTALRCSGIYGPGRYRLITKVASETIWEENSWTNRVHRDDVVRALCHLGEKSLTGSLLASCYNVTDDTPVSMWEVKLAIAQWLNAAVALPKDERAFLPVSGKRISNQTLKETGFSFQYPSYVKGYQELVSQYRMSDAV